MKAMQSYHPLTLFVYFVAVLGISMFLQNPIIQIQAVCGGLLCLRMLLPSKEWRRALLWYAMIFVAVTLTNPLFSHQGDTVLFTLGNIPFTLQALAYGGGMGLLLVGTMVWFRCYSETVTEEKFLFLFGKCAPKTALLLTMSLRFIPLFRRRMRAVFAAQKGMGLYADKTLSEKLKSTARMFISLLTWSLENAMDTAAVMKARGYGQVPRTAYTIYRFTLRDGVLLAVYVLLFGITLGNVSAFAYYPRLSVIPPSIAGYIAFGVLTVLPCIFHVKEAIVWRCYLSKT